jgi:ABC-type antimicrobial peptide transport system permease subunit
MWTVASESIRSVVAGAAVGLAVAVLAARTLHALLFGIDAADPLTFIVVVGALLSSAVAAALLAAGRATRVDLVMALRGE